MSKEYVVFRNKGVIDPKSITTFGVSSKESDSAIGFFGTGLKYAIAILLREGCSITIYAGLERLDFGTSVEKVRVDEFTFVTMNGERLGFTTEVGKTWEVWQAFREVYCNTLDERGEFFTCAEPPAPCDDETMIVVHGRPFLEAWNNRSQIVLHGEPLAALDGVEVHSGQSEYIYYRGIRAHKLNRASLYTYNVTAALDLTEDRTIKHSFYADYYIAKALCGMTDKHHLQRILTAPDSDYEHSLDYERGATPSQQFSELVRLMARQFNAKVNRSAVRLCQGSILEQLDEMDTAPMNEVDQARMNRAIAFCKKIGFMVDDYPIVVSEFLGEDVLGRAHNERIYISRRVLMMGTKMLAGTLIEEFLHLRYQLRDESYQMQNFLFDALVSMGEQLVGEPL